MWCSEGNSAWLNARHVSKWLHQLPFAFKRRFAPVEEHYLFPWLWGEAYSICYNFLKSHKRENPLFHVLCWGGWLLSFTQLCSELLPGSVPRDHSWAVLGNHTGCWDWTCKTNASSAVFSFQPLTHFRHEWNFERTRTYRLCELGGGSHR